MAVAVEVPVLEEAHAGDAILTRAYETIEPHRIAGSLSTEREQLHNIAYQHCNQVCISCIVCLTEHHRIAKPARIDT